MTTAPTTPNAAPAGVRDPLLWLDATELADRHRPDPSEPSRCASHRCRGRAYPCAFRRLAESALAASSGPWHRCWTGRLDLRSAAGRA